MRIAILGATSQIAKDLVLAFSKQDSHELVLFARRPEIVTHWLVSVGLSGYAVSDFAGFSTEVHFDAILSFVGVGDPSQAAAMGASIFDVTLKYDQMALSYLEHHPLCRYVFLSSGAAYGSSFDAPVDENTKATVAINNLQPQDWYAVAKLHAECRHRSLTHLPIIDIRVFNYFSHTQDMSARFLITDIIRAVRDKTVLKTSSDYIVRDFIHPSDFYKLIVALLASPATNAVVDCYSKAPIDKPALLAAMQDNFGLRYEVITTSAGVNATGNKPHYYSLNTKAEDFGYQPSLTSLDGLLLEAKQICTHSVPLFEKEGLGEILLDKSSTAPSYCPPTFSKREVNNSTNSMTAFVIKILQLFGINRAIGFGVLTRMWSMLAGPLTILLIAKHFSNIEQGYYYTFYSLIGLQVFFELGLLTVLAQFAAHEFAYLSWGKKGEITGSEPHLNRFIDLLGKGFKWYSICAILLIVTLIPAGLFFLIQASTVEAAQINWKLPWILTVIGVGFNLLLIPFYGVITGSGDVVSIQRRELMGGMTSSIIGWVVIASGGGLFAIPAVTTGTIIVGLIYLFKSKPKLVKTAFLSAFGQLKSTHSIAWWGEVWPMQWKIALSWISGYLIFQLFTPVLFKYHGPIVAGQMGMSMGIWSAILGTCSIWASVKAPVFGKLIATNNWKELDIEFFKILRQSMLVSVLICTLALAIIYVLQKYTFIGERLLPVQYIAYLFIALFAQVIINNFAIYLRAHKKEPYLLLSVFGGLLQGTCVIVIGRLFSFQGITLGFAGIQSFLLLPAFIIWLHCRKKWHQKTPCQSNI